MTTSPESPLRIRLDRVEYTIVDAQAIVLNVESSEYYALNDTGTALWAVLRDGATESELRRVLQDRGATPEEARADLAAFLGDLSARGMLADEPRR